jgi:glucuronate isomerase
MTASAPTGLDPIWPAEPRARSLAVELYQSVAGRPLVSVHNGLPARYLAEDLPFTDPISLLIAHDQGVQALLRAHGVRTEFSPTEGWQTQASRQAFVLLWRHMVDVRAKTWMLQDASEIDNVAGLPRFRAGEAPESVYDTLATRLAAAPIYPRRVLAAANLRLLATSDDPADDLQAHMVLAEDQTWAGRIVPTFSPDRYLQPDRRGWRTDADLLAEITGIDTEELPGFLEALQQRRTFFAACGAIAVEHHTSDLPTARLPDAEAADLYQHARSGELLPGEVSGLQGHLLWEMARMSSEDGLVMSLYPPAGFRSGTPTESGSTDRGVADRVRTLLSDFGTGPRFRLRLFTIDTDAYTAEILPLAAEHPALTAVPPTRFADDPAILRAIRETAIETVGVERCLGLVDDMSGPFALAARHRLGRRLDAGALAALVVAGRLTADQAHADLISVTDRA